MGEFDKNPRSATGGADRVQAGDGIRIRLLWSCSALFFLLASYTLLRPLRDELGSRTGTDGLQHSFTATFACMLFAVPLFGALSSRLSRTAFLTLMFSFFAIGFVLFGLGFSTPGPHHALARVFFTWVSIFNLTMISLVWSVVTEAFSPGEAKGVFGKIAAGAGLGAVAGPGLTFQLVGSLSPGQLIFISVLLLLFSGGATIRLATYERRNASPSLPPGAFSGLLDVLRSPVFARIAGIVFLSNVVGTLLYFQQADFFKTAGTDPSLRARLFASVDLAVNILTLGTQLFATDTLVRRFGLRMALLFTPLLCAAGFTWFAVNPVLSTLICFQVIRRAAIYAIGGPAKELLFTVVPTEKKYKTKNCIDTLIYRTGDTSGAWIYAELIASGVSVAGVCGTNVFLCFLISWLSIRAAKDYERAGGGTIRHLEGP